MKRSSIFIHFWNIGRCACNQFFRQTTLFIDALADSATNYAICSIDIVWVASSRCFAAGLGVCIASALECSTILPHGNEAES
jgi:hypothetical protein